MNMMTLIMCVLFIDSKYASSFRLLTVRLLLVLSELENGMCFLYKNWLCLLDFWKWCLLDIRFLMLENIGCICLNFRQCVCWIYDSVFSKNLGEFCA